MSWKSIGYWLETVLVVLAMGSGGVAELTRVPANGDGIVRVLGYPEHFLIILGVWKVLSVIALLAPGFPRLKEWGYAGIFSNLTGAAAGGSVDVYRKSRISKATQRDRRDNDLATTC
jgi:hypothetical protein